jgi:hypothetical protein
VRVLDSVPQTLDRKVRFPNRDLRRRRFFNVFAGVYVAARNLFLKETGRKLAHI